MTENDIPNAEDIDDILGDIDDNETDRAIDSIIRFADHLTEVDVAQIMDAARVADSTFSGPGAEIRDTLRDNTNYDI